MKKMGSMFLVLMGVLMTSGSTLAMADETALMPAIPVVTDDPLLNKANLDRIKRHIIEGGVRCTYSSKYNGNPCWTLAGYNYFLNPDPGPDGHAQWNIDCDVRRGDFNTLVIRGGNHVYVSIDFLRAESITISPSWRSQESAEDEALLRQAVTAALAAIERDTETAADG